MERGDKVLFARDGAVHSGIVQEVATLDVLVHDLHTAFVFWIPTKEVSEI